MMKIHNRMSFSYSRIYNLFKNAKSTKSNQNIPWFFIFRLQACMIVWRSLQMTFGVFKHGLDSINGRPL